MENINCLVMGDNFVGKTSLIHRMTDNIYFNISSVKEYMFNILDHHMVPQHRVMTNAEKDKIKTKFNVVKDKEFPEISRFDPVAKVIGLRPGQLCEIIRPSPTSIKSIYYRLCI